MTPAKTNLVALGSAAVLTVYGAGYVRTQAAADRFAGDDGTRHPAKAAVVHLADSSAALTPEIRVDSALPETSHPSLVAPVARPQGSKPTSKDTTPAIPLPASKGSDTSPAAVPITVLSDSSAAPHVVVTTAPAPTASTTLQGTQTASATDSASSGQAQRPLYRDGTYSGWGTSRHGDIQATVQIQDGRIISATITQCLTRYSCSRIAALPPQVVSRQSADVDYVSGATQSANAFYYAVVEALAKAK